MRVINYARPDAPKMPLLWPEYKQERIEWAWTMYLQRMEDSEWLEDDNIPCLHILAGTEKFAEAFGCKVHRPRDSCFTGAIPMIHSPEDAEKVKIPRLEDTPLMLLFDIADELRDRAGKDAIFRIPGMMCPMDMGATIWDKTDLFVSMLDEPESVKALCAKCRDFLVQFADAWFERYGHDEFLGHYPGYYMNTGISMTVDEIGNVSSEMYKEFFEEDLHFLSERYGGMGIHCCANSKHQWENLKRIPGLKLLNLDRPEAVLRESYEYFRDIAAMWPEKMEHNVPEPMENPRMDSIPKGCHLVLTANASTRDEALRALEHMNREYRVSARKYTPAQVQRP